MTICNAWDVVVVAFPYVDMPQAKPRPALVLSSQRFNAESGHCLAAMITTTKRTHWPADTPITDLASAGLTAPSIIRLKLFTLDNRLQPRIIGHLAAADITTFRQNFMEHLG